MSSTITASPRADVATADEQRRANDRLWSRTGLIGAYANRTLRPVEVMLLVRYRAELSGRVLELGCGGGRVTGYLAEIATSAHGIDISPEMVDYCRRTYPKATFSEGDLREVVRMGPGSFDAVVAPNNILDVLGDAERREVLEGIHQLLSPHGLLILSSHNLANAPHRTDPLRFRGFGLFWTALNLVKWPRWELNRRRLIPFERTEADYSILNDISHDYMALHYYISRDAQERQLVEQGFEFVECLDLDGKRIELGESADYCSELQYVAIRRPDDEPAEVSSSPATA